MVTLTQIRGWLARSWRKLGLTAALFGFFYVALQGRIDPDFGWHLEAGRYMLAHGVPYHDIFSYSAPNFPWINHEWLSDVLMAAAYNWAGYWLVAAVAAALWTGAIIIAARSWRWVVLALGFAAVISFTGVRPNAWSALFLAVTLEMIRRHWRWPLIPLFVLWANLHGGFVIGFIAVLFAAWKDRKYLWVLAASIPATFLNPYGPHMYVEIWRTLGDSELRRYVTEWRPLQVEPLSGLYIVIFIFTAVALGWRKWTYALPGFLLASSVSSLRQFPLFVISSLHLVADGYEALLKYLNIQRGWKHWLLIGLATALMVAPTYKILIDPQNGIPEAEIADLTARPCPGNIYNEYDFGGFIVWMMPGTKVFIDGRMPSWKDGSHSYLMEWYEVLGSTEAAHKAFAKYDIQCAMLQRRHARLVKQLLDEGWVVTAHDRSAVVLRRTQP